MLAIILGFSLFLFVFLMIIRNNRDKLFEKIPLPTVVPYLPILGHTLAVAINRQAIFDLIYTYDPDITPVRIEFLNKKIVVIGRPEDIQIILNSSKCLSKNYFYKFVGAFIGDGLLTASVPTWKKHRRIVLPTFNQSILNQFIDGFSESAKIFLKVIEKTDGKTFDIFDPTYNYTLDLIYKNAMGLKIDSQTQSSKLVSVMTRAREIVMKRLTNIFYIIDFTFKFTTLFKTQEEDIKYLDDICQRAINDKRSKFLNNNYEKEYTEDKNKIFLDKLMTLRETSDTLTDTELINEVKTFIISGTDTTSLTASFVFLMIAMHPEIQKKVYEEIIDVLGPSRSVIYTDIDKFLYLEKVIKETMRLFPIGPLLARQVDEDIKLSTCTIPKGCDVILAIATVMRSAKYFPDPLKFDPERFTPEEISKRSPYTYLPFSGGSRNCIGRHYAMASLKTIISMSVREFWFETDYKRIEDIKLLYTLLVTVQDGFPIRATKRTIY